MSQEKRDEMVNLACDAIERRNLFDKFCLDHSWAQEQKECHWMMWQHAWRCGQTSFAWQRGVKMDRYFGKE